MNKLDDLVFSCQRKEVYVKVYKTKIGYDIESFMPDREKQLEITSYANSEKYNNQTEWTMKKLTSHGLEEIWGLIIPLDIY